MILDIIKNNKWNTFVIAVALLMLLFAAVNRLDYSNQHTLTEAGRQAYMQSAGFEILLSVILMITFLVNIILILKHLITRKWKKLSVTFCVVIVSVILWFAALLIDSPTLVHMT